MELYLWSLIKSIICMYVEVSRVKNVRLGVCNVEKPHKHYFKRPAVNKFIIKY